MLSLHFKRLYHSYEPEGWPPKDAIVTYGKKPYTARSCDHGEQGHEVIVEYKKAILIDLWLVKLRFKWIGKGETCPNLKTMDQANA